METNNKLREALAAILGIADHVQMRFEIPKLPIQEISELKQIAEAALAEPIKNCEVGTAMEQGERFSAYCRAHKHPKSECLICPLFGQTGGYCELAWAQMPYEEGGAK